MSLRLTRRVLTAAHVGRGQPSLPCPKSTPRAPFVHLNYPRLITSMSPCRAAAAGHEDSKPHGRVPNKGLLVSWSPLWKPVSNLSEASLRSGAISAGALPEEILALKPWYPHRQLRTGNCLEYNAKLPYLKGFIHGCLGSRFYIDPRFLICMSCP